MQVAEDLKYLLTGFTQVSEASHKLIEENEKLKEELTRKNKKLIELTNLSLKNQQDLQKKQEMMEMVHQQLGIVPELKNKVGELTDALLDMEKKIESKDQELSRLKQKHLADLDALKNDIEKERNDSRDEEDKRIKEMEEFLTRSGDGVSKPCEKMGTRKASLG